MSFSSPTIRTAALFAALALVVLASTQAYAADLKQNPKIAPGLPATTNPSGAEAVGKLMNPPQPDPSLPLQNPNLAQRLEAEPAPQKPQIYGRGEQGGQKGSVLEGLVGVRIPFPAASSAGSSNTTYSSGDSTSSGDLRSR